MTFDELLKQMVQTSRRQPSAVLYGGDLQDNTTLSFNEQKYEETPVSNKAPTLFRNYGSAITDRDDRMFMTPQPQVPANPELEALNDYFNQRRVEQFARSSQNLIVGETIQKQAEQTATAVVRDEMDRRAGIRRAVLERTGLTPGQIQQQMVSESLAGVNPRTMDMREQQIQDAVNLYYNINNIPQPVTAPQTNPVPATVPSGTIQEPEDTLERNEAELLPEDQLPPLEEEELVSPEEVPELEPAERPAEMTFPNQVVGKTREELADYIIAYNIRDTQTTHKRGGQIGELLGRRSLIALGAPTLQQIVIDHISRQRGRGGAGSGNLNNPVLAEPSANINMDELD
jgi:hypothetical protein